MKAFVSLPRHDPQEGFEGLRRRLFNEALLLMCLVSTPGVLLSVGRSLVVGWQPVFLLQLGLAGLLWGLWLGRARLSFHVRIYGLFLLLWLVFITGASTFGPAALAGQYIILAAFFAVLFQGGRSAAAVIALTALSVSVIVWLVLRGSLEFTFSYREYASHPMVWLQYAWSLCAHATVLAFIGWRMVQALHAREQHARELADRQTKIAAHVPGVIFQLRMDTQGRASFPYASEGTLRYFGIAPEQLQADATPILKLVPLEDRDRLWQAIQGSARKLTPCQESFRILHPDLGLHWVEAIATPERLSDGDILWHGFMRDVTMRQLAIDALRHERDMAQRYLDTVQTMMLSLDRQGRVTMINRQGCAILGYEEQEILGAHWFQKFLPQPQGLEQGYPTFLDMLHQGRAAPQNFEYPVLCRDGQERLIAWHYAHLVDDQGQTTGLLASGEDITQRTLAEQELRTAKELAEEASQAKTAFLASMSHELRTPLNSIIGFAQILELGQNPPLDPAQQESVGHIITSGRHLLGLINEVLDLAGIESGKLRLDVSAVPLAKVVQAAMSLSQPVAEARRVRLDSECPGDLHIRADVARVRQILLNLLSNAIKYNREGGEVRLSVTRENARVRIHVADTGPGIPLERQKELFQPFSRLGAERTAAEGAGIGLVVSKSLAEAMGGSIGYENLSEGGSRFWVEFPLAANSPPDQPDLPAARPETPRTMAGCVVYVEDNLANVAVMRHLFRHFPQAELHIAASAEEGLPLIRKLQPNLVLMDINLPGGMNGLAALQGLRTDPITRHIPVVAISAAAQPSEVEHGLKMGFEAYLTKPFDIPQLMNLIERHLQGMPPC